MTKEELLNHIVFKSEDEKESAKFYIDMKGIALHVRVLNYLGYIFNGDNKISWKKLSSTLKKDKKLRDKVYIYLATLEEYIRAYISNKYEDSPNQAFWVNGRGRNNQIKRRIENGESVSAVLDEVEFGTLVAQIKKLPDEDKSAMFGQVYSDKNIDAVRELRNAVSHHQFLQTYSFKECTVDGKTSNTLDNNLLNLRQLLPKEYRYGKDGKGGFTVHLAQCGVLL